MASHFLLLPHHLDFSPNVPVLNDWPCSISNASYFAFCVLWSGTLDQNSGKSCDRIQWHVQLTGGVRRLWMPYTWAEPAIWMWTEKKGFVRSGAMCVRVALDLRPSLLTFCARKTVEPPPASLPNRCRQICDYCWRRVRPLLYFHSLRSCFSHDISTSDISLQGQRRFQSSCLLLLQFCQEGATGGRELIIPVWRWN